MRITLVLDTDNAAFDDCAGTEVARILICKAKQIENWPGKNEFKLVCLDICGNKVGWVKARKLHS